MLWLWYRQQFLGPYRTLVIKYHPKRQSNTPPTGEVIPLWLIFILWMWNFICAILALGLNMGHDEYVKFPIIRNLFFFNKFSYWFDLVCFKFVRNFLKQTLSNFQSIPPIRHTMKQVLYSRTTHSSLQKNIPSRKSLKNS